MQISLRYSQERCASLFLQNQTSSCLLMLYALWYNKVISVWIIAEKFPIYILYVFSDYGTVASEIDIQLWYDVERIYKEKLLSIFHMPNYIVLRMIFEVYSNWRSKAFITWAVVYVRYIFVHCCWFFLVVITIRKISFYKKLIHYFKLTRECVRVV